MKPEEVPFHPNIERQRIYGISLREWYAGLAIQSLIPIAYRIYTDEQISEEGEKFLKKIAEATISHADAMMQELGYT